MHSHGGLANPMRGGHAAPAVGGLASSAGASPRPQVSLRASLPVPVAERPATGRPGTRAIWVRRVTVFFPGDFARHAQGARPVWNRTLQCTGARAHVHVHGGLAARLVRNRFGLGVGMGAV